MPVRVYVAPPDAENVQQLYVPGGTRFERAGDQVLIHDTSGGLVATFTAANIVGVVIEEPRDAEKEQRRNGDESRRPSRTPDDDDAIKLGPGEATSAAIGAQAAAAQERQGGPVSE